MTLALACSRKESTDATPQASVSAAVQAPPGTEPTLFKRLEAVARDCTPDAQLGTLSCKGPEKQKLLRELKTESAIRSKAFETLTTALGDKDPKLQALAASLLRDAFQRGFDQAVPAGGFTRFASRRITDQLPKLPAALGQQVAAVAVHVSMLGSDAEHLYEVLDASPTLATAAYPYLMVHGRLDAFDKIKKLTEDKQSPLALAALDAPRNMSDWKPEEQAAICPWAKAFLSEGNEVLTSKAAQLLVRCGGEYVDAVLLDAEQALARKDLSSTRLSPLRTLCSTRGREAGSTEEQCVRSRKLHESAAKLDKLESSTRLVALSSLASQWPDAETLKLARALSVTKPKELAQSAKSIVERLTRRLAPSPIKPKAK